MRGVRFRTTSDTEVLLHLYILERAEMVHRLRGMFAFVIWDGERRGLFLARDPYGIKPLYTANDGWTFRFASQVKALIAGGRISQDPEPAGLAGSGSCEIRPPAIRAFTCEAKRNVQPSFAVYSGLMP